MDSFNNYQLNSCTAPFSRTSQKVLFPTSLDRENKLLKLSDMFLSEIIMEHHTYNFKYLKTLRWGADLPAPGWAIETVGQRSTTLHPENLPELLYCMRRMEGVSQGVSSSEPADD